MSDGQGYVKTWLSDTALIVFVVTVTAYAFAYSYEFGVCEALGIPWGYVSLQARDIVGDLIMLVTTFFPHLIMLAIFVVSAIGIGVALRHDRDSPTGLNSRQLWTAKHFLALRSAFIWIALLVSFITFDRSLTAEFVGALVFTAVILILGYVVVQIFEKDQLRPYAFEVVAYLVFLVAISGCIGYYWALTPQSYAFLDGNRNTIVLRAYSDRFVTAQYDCKTRSLTSYEEINSLGQKVHWKRVALKPQKYVK
jgi:hypothetical protein